jgi:CheY-like chemotaxis protein
VNANVQTATEQQWCPAIRAECNGGTVKGLRDLMAWVLLVDDDQVLRETLRFMLQDAGYDVEEAEDGMRALDILRATPHRMVVLLDLMMPRVSGTTMLQTVADDTRLSTQHAYILMTANSRAVDAALHAMLAQLSAPALDKPFDLDALLDAVAQAARRLNGVNGVGEHRTDQP